jgi:nucleoside 2-deoxyribosyltransferase
MIPLLKPRVYLAGPEVFLPDPIAAGRAKVELCAAAGFEGCYPLDAALVLDGLPKAEQARRISLANEALMRSCDLLIANLTPFRGVSMDSGTAFEVGFMRALGRPVLGYTNITADYRDRAGVFRADHGSWRDGDRADVDVEDFGLAENLMIEIAITESGGDVVRTPVPGDRTIEDLTGFRICLEQARALLL